MSYTHGPWVFDNCGPRVDGMSSYRIIDDDNQIVCTTSESNVSGDDRQDCHNRIEANARLIAAAPELLDALKAVHTILTDRRSTTEALKLIESEIRKVEGK